MFIKFFDCSFNRGGVYKILVIFFSHKIKNTYKILKSSSSSFIIFFICKVKRGSSFDNVLIQKLKRGINMFSREITAWFRMKILKKGGGCLFEGAFNRSNTVLFSLTKKVDRFLQEEYKKYKLTKKMSIYHFHHHRLHDHLRLLSFNT